MALAGGCDHRAAAPAGLPLPRRRDPLARRALPLVRRTSHGTVFGSGAGVVVLKRARRRAARRRHDPRRACAGLRCQQRRRPEGRLSRAQRRGPGGGRSTGAGRAGGVSPRVDHLCRGARHRHARRRSDRGGGPHAGLPAGHVAHGILPHRLGEEQHRPHGHRRRRRELHQGRAGAQAPGDPRVAALQRAQSGLRLRDEPLRRERGTRAVDGDLSPPRGRELPRRRWHQRVRDRRRGADAAAHVVTASNRAARALGALARSAGPQHRAARGVPALAAGDQPRRRRLDAADGPPG